MRGLDVPVPDPIPAGWKRMKNPLMEELGANPSQCPAFKGPNGIVVCLTLSRELDGKLWLHASVSYRLRRPSYDDLCNVKNLFIGPDRMAYQLFPPKSEHVNIMKYCLHLWHCIDGAVTPDFTLGMGTI